MTAGFGQALRSRPFQRIGLAAEHLSPENPDGSEVRVALTPSAVSALVRNGCAVAVERGAGEALGLSDALYTAAGAAVETRDALYRDKDLVIKLKGPAHHDLSRMDPGSTLLCMAHPLSIPERVEVANARGVNVVAMELIRESPEVLTDSYVRSRLAMHDILSAVRGQAAEDLSVALIGFSHDAFGGLQYAARRRPRSLRVLQSRPAAPATVTVGFGELEEAAARIGAARVAAYRAERPPRPYGRRRIHCLHETGRAGARFGIELALRHGPCAPAGLRVCLLGYGNVAFGALDECVRHGVREIDVLTKRATRRPHVVRYLRSSDLVINGAELPPPFRGTHYLVTEDDLRSVLRPGTVVVDLVGGCATNRTAVEPIVESTHPSRPCLVRHGVYLASVWGWPLLGFAKESAERYSRQITDVLLARERLIDGLASAPENILRALVAGPALGLRPSSQPVTLSATLRG
ncbi:hypothetical protein [Streptomyces griseocarneus]|uniref:hypothetical protein n=1 Tax=Streptomyces griseocarneus TaxID=51201 RepID=UPI00198B7B81|nr:hypothetical protein [Streptomyces griseocarneus]MBZ6472774.1 hypothetical protein [Streptomyces griseocarneus]GHG47255.1 NAD(P) transhydrogenase subunit alpha [Streptomyces griseocarneus]